MKSDKYWTSFASAATPFGFIFFDVGVERECEDQVRGVREGVEVDQFFDLSRKTEESGGHDVREVLGEGRHVGAGFGFEGWGHPVGSLSMCMDFRKKISLS